MTCALSAHVVFHEDMKDTGDMGQSGGNMPLQGAEDTPL